MTNRTTAITAALILLAATFLAVTTGLRSLDWSEEEIPGFFIDPSRHVSVLSLPGWPITGAPLPTAITHIDGTRLKSADHLYQMVRAKPPGASIQYSTESLGGLGPAFAAPARVFDRVEMSTLFLSLILNGLLTIAIALSVWRQHAGSSQARAFFFAGLSLGALAIATVAVASAGTLSRLQILAQPLAAAALIHLAAVFPTNVLRNGRAPALFAIYGPFAALAVVYQLIWPDTYGTGLLHGVSSLSLAAAAAGFVASLALRLLPRNPIVVRRRAAIAISGIVAVALASLLWAIVKGADWRAITAALCTCGAVIPLATGAAIAAPDFFALDRRLRAILTYGLAIPAVAVLYLGSVYLISPKIAASSSFVATIPFALLNLALLFAIAPVVRVVSGWVDRFFSPETYSTDRSLANLNRGLSSARTTQTLVSNTLEVLRRTLLPESATVYLRGRGAGFPLFAYDDPEQRKIAVPNELAEKLEAGENAIRYQWDDGSGREVPRLLDRLAADMLVPIYRGGSCVGAIALAGKKSGHPYDSRDVSLIRTAADQIALALPNAAAQDKLDVLHKNLDELSESLRVQTNRTETLKAMNTELGDALNKLRETHHQLTQNQQHVLRVERLAALSRLSVGLTREISGPIGSVLNSLRGIAKIGKEHAELEREPAKQREALDEIMALSQNAAAWLERAIAYLRSFQSLGHGAKADKLESFAVRDAFNDVTQLLRARLRETECEVEYKEDPESLQLYGSRQRFTLVLVDLVTAAAQAYEDNQARDAKICIEAELTSQGVCVRVIDWAGGVPAAAVPRLLEELGVDHELGNRRGLWIAKNLVEEGFGGTLEAVTNDEHTCFSAIFPSVFTQSGPMAPPPSLRQAAN